MKSTLLLLSFERQSISLLCKHSWHWIDLGTLVNSINLCSHSLVRALTQHRYIYCRVAHEDQGTTTKASHMKEARLTGDVSAERNKQDVVSS